jgi:hypothetical protein
MALALLVVGTMTSLPVVASELAWTDAAGVKIPVPPSEHPRLFLRHEHTARLPARFQDSVLQPTVKRLEAIARKSPQGHIEWQALQYLAKPSRAEGRATIQRALTLLKQTDLDDRQDVCRDDPKGEFHVRESTR